MQILVWHFNNHMCLLQIVLEMLKIIIQKYTAVSCIQHKMHIRPLLGDLHWDSLKPKRNLVLRGLCFAIFIMAPIIIYVHLRCDIAMLIVILRTAPSSLMAFDH